MQNYIGVNGLVTQELAEIREQLTNDFISIYGDDINLDSSTADAQWLNILAQQKIDVIDLFKQMYNNLDVDRVVGIPQQILYKLNGLTIKTYGYSYVYINVNVGQSVTLDGLDENIESIDGIGYTVRDGVGNRWILTNSVDLAPGVHTLNFRAADIGAVTAAANTINIMETVVTGVQSVNNPGANYITGNSGETTSEFRLRRNRSVALPSQGYDEAIEAQILQLDNVVDCKVYDNRSDSVENGIPAHSVWVIVEGGNAQDIGKVIYYNVPPGIGMYGNESIAVQKANGNNIIVNYGNAQAEPLQIMATIKSFSADTLDEDYIKAQLVEKMSFKIGEMAESANITTILKEIIGETGTPFSVEIADNRGVWSEYITPQGLDQYYSVSADNIILTIEGV